MPIARHSTISEMPVSAGDVVWVPFPFVDAPRMRERPALVIGTVSPSSDMQLLWVLMITSAENRGWHGDISLEQSYIECGLNVPCVIRTAKVSTVEARRARRSGSVPDEVLAAVRKTLKRQLF